MNTYSCNLFSVKVLTDAFLDDVAAATFKRDLERLGAVLMPFARAIQCLEAKETTAADVYKYWLAVTAQIHDLISKDESGTRAVYGTTQTTSEVAAITTKELIRAITNFRFSQLIENQRASNIYLTAFALDPGNVSLIENHSIAY